MKFSKADSGTSLLEVLISMSLFSFFALQTLAFCLKLHNLTRQSLYDTRNVIIAESRHQQGFSLVELMIALALSLILSLAFIQTILITKNIYRKQEGLARIQENARSIHHIIGDAISRTGAIGCNRMSDEMGVVIHPGVNIKRLGLQPFSELEPNRSDSLWIKYTTKGYPLAVPSTGEKGYFVIHGKPNWKENRVLILSDCRHAEIFRLAENTKVIKRGLSEVAFKHTAGTYKYDTSAQIARLRSVLFYVAKTHRVNQYNEPIFALYSKDYNGKTQERVEGVEAMKVEYKPQSIRIEFLLSSVEPVKSEQGESVLRQWWTWEWSLPGAR